MEVVRTLTLHHAMERFTHGNGRYHDADGGTICVSHDISQRISAQRERAETEIKYRNAHRASRGHQLHRGLGTYANGSTSARRSNPSGLHRRRMALEFEKLDQPRSSR